MIEHYFQNFTTSKHQDQDYEIEEVEKVNYRGSIKDKNIEIGIGKANNTFNSLKYMLLRRFYSEELIQMCILSYCMVLKNGLIKHYSAWMTHPWITIFN